MKILKKLLNWFWGANQFNFLNWFLKNIKTILILLVLLLSGGSWFKIAFTQRRTEPELQARICSIANKVEKIDKTLLDSPKTSSLQPMTLKLVKEELEKEEMYNYRHQPTFIFDESTKFPKSKMEPCTFLFRDTDGKEVQITGIFLSVRDANRIHLTLEDNDEPDSDAPFRRKMLLALLGVNLVMAICLACSG